MKILLSSQLNFIVVTLLRFSILVFSGRIIIIIHSFWIALVVLCILLLSIIICNTNIYVYCYLDVSNILRWLYMFSRSMQKLLLPNCANLNFWGQCLKLRNNKRECFIQKKSSKLHNHHHHQYDQQVSQ